MMKPDSTFNLSALADRLFLEKRLLPLASKIRRARDLRSLSVDLEIALESLNALDALLETQNTSDDFLRKATESALLNNALILYVRATKTTSQHRTGFDLRSRFSEEEKQAHKELVDLRDHAIAHFGLGGDYMGEWQAELVILQLKGPEAKPAVVTRRKVLDEKLTRRARKQIEAAWKLLGALSLQHLDQVTKELNAAMTNDPEFQKEIIQHPLNLEVFMTSAESAESVRASFGNRFAKGSTTPT